MSQQILKLLFFSSFLLNYQLLHAQNPLTADAGSDQAICVDINSGVDSVLIGGQPSVAGGIPPYSYSWSCLWVDPSGYVTYASHFLNDTTLANPMVIDYSNYYSDDINLPFLYLTVTDSIGNSRKDSIRITFSTFGMTLGGPQTFYLTQGDSVYCCGNSIFGGIGPLTVNWNPANGILSYDNQAFWASPVTTTSYTLTVTDTVGCIQTGTENDVTVVVFPLGIKDGVPNTTIRVYPNPASDYIQVERKVHVENETFSLYDITGKEILKTQVQSSSQQINVSRLARGSYTFIIRESTGQVILN